MSNETNEIENLQGKHRYGVGITLDGDQDYKPEKKSIFNNLQ